ncbi:chemotaxis protein CheW [Nitrosococcus oceani]|uniref:CheW-like protein n=2 Tax=Nitrosococcus oceani TaxID=1229 RepID=Q3JET4_NITOC|nr:chemotaxis protein CheW [Nitrosococcus oceani]KFI20908.1 chemotaxis protein CheW [Nitrosococcus oceani C-27]ABA56662.1 CheW-like protein [Nitrosococcus oceani ATCC 19707]EDZ65499.1 hypothetical protein NOC27_2179 [Nitrosococcus oceani AFC27]KFI23991.1 chemotaxis protein CheW [Nitrosococcus oceani]GEM20768.1 chemotaxis protein CheW [Nitrosococcus oceani]
MDKNNPFSILRNIEAQNRQHGAALPQQTAIRQVWTNLGFLLGNQKLAALLTQVYEVFPCPAITRVPGAKPWVVGVANIRGYILPLIDLHAYIYGAPSQRTHRSKVLVVTKEKFLIGLLVEEVFGLKHFLDEEWTGQNLPSHDPLTRYIQRGFAQNREIWLEFDFHLLMEQESFFLATT